MDLNLPVQAVVNRLSPSDISALSEDRVLFGGLPGDPGPFSTAIDPRLRGCEMFPGHGCLYGIAYF